MQNLPPDNPANPIFVHISGSRWRLTRGDAEWLAADLEETARAAGIPQSFRRVNRGTTVIALGTALFAERCLGLKNVKQIRITWNRGDGAYLVIIGYVDHIHVARQLTKFCYDSDRICYWNVASVEVGVAIERPSDALVQRLSHRTAAAPARGRIHDLFVLRGKLRLSRGRSIGVSIRCYVREGDVNEGGAKVEVSTTRFLTLDDERALLDPRSRTTLVELIRESRALLLNFVRRHGLRVLAMPLTYRGFPIVLGRRPSPNLIKDSPGGQMRRGWLLHATPDAVEVPASTVAPATDASRQSTSAVVTEVGVPIFSNDPDVAVWQRLGEFIPIQQARFERSRVGAPGGPHVLADLSPATATQETTGGIPHAENGSRLLDCDPGATRDSAPTKVTRVREEHLVIDGSPLPPLLLGTRVRDADDYFVRVESAQLTARFLPDKGHVYYELVLRLRVVDGRAAGRVFPWTIRHGQHSKFQLLADALDTTTPSGADVDGVLVPGLLGAEFLVSIGQVDEYCLFIEKAYYLPWTAQPGQPSWLSERFAELQEERLRLIADPASRAKLPRVGAGKRARPPKPTEEP